MALSLTTDPFDEIDNNTNVGDNPPAKPDTTPKDPAPTAEDKLAALEAERDQLQAQLDRLALSSYKQGKELDSLRSAPPAKPAAPPAPDPIETAKAEYNKLTDEIAELDAKVSEAEDSDPAEARKLNRLLRIKEREHSALRTDIAAELARQAATKTAAETSQQTAAKIEFQEMLRDLRKEYPVIDVTADTGVKTDLVEEVNRIYLPMMRSGEVSPAEALRTATELVMKANGIAPASTAAPPAKKEEAAPTRKEEAVNRNIDALKNTPPDITPFGKSQNADSILDKYDMAGMSIEDFMKLPDAEVEAYERALARADFG